jgi:hypothetical protein
MKRHYLAMSSLLSMGAFAAVLILQAQDAPAPAADKAKAGAPKGKGRAAVDTPFRVATCW